MTVHISNLIKIDINYECCSYILNYRFKFKSLVRLHLSQDIIIPVFVLSNWIKSHIFRYFYFNCFNTSYNILYSYFSGESSIDREYMQTGDITFNFTVIIVVKVFDFFGDYTEVKSKEFVVIKGHLCTLLLESWF